MKFKQMALAAVIAGGFVGLGQAATDGSVGDSSNGNFDINLNIPGNVGIWGLRDLGFTTTSAQSQTVKACVFSSTENVQFQVVNNTDFELRDGGTKGADFTVTITENGASGGSIWGDSGLSTGDTSPKNYNVTDASLPADISTAVCTGNDQTIDIVVGITPVASPANGTYTSNVELVVSAI
ncbi:hypothetical protein EOPP23_06125 [Endozoicomonas sp. OPT23]|uniref:hypothetical protein n=1 Tax=Endozoicomonas sp. OPT23 TaxID=2072845 RepID=UPI00129A6570|nr:hypothetical protein [Endozoicomonas sp. OPT23]MRI32562.1 hypothetical protein [Endozoicomonas sp. OPT23]